jgi:hypothetical protein
MHRQRKSQNQRRSPAGTVYSWLEKVLAWEIDRSWVISEPLLHLILRQAGLRTNRVELDKTLPTLLCSRVSGFTVTTATTAKEDPCLDRDPKFVALGYDVVVFLKMQNATDDSVSQITYHTQALEITHKHGSWWAKIISSPVPNLLSSYYG